MFTRYSRIMSCICAVITAGIMVACADSRTNNDRKSNGRSCKLLDPQKVLYVADETKKQVDLTLSLSDDSFLKTTGTPKFKNTQKRSIAYYTYGYNSCNGLAGCKLDIKKGVALLKKAILLEGTGGAVNAAAYLLKNYSPLCKYSDGSLPQKEKLESILKKNNISMEELRALDYPVEFKLYPSKCDKKPVLRVVYYRNIKGGKSSNGLISGDYYDYYSRGINLYRCLQETTSKFIDQYGEDGFAMGFYVSKADTPDLTKSLLLQLLKQEEDKKKMSLWELDSFDEFPSSIVELGGKLLIKLGDKKKLRTVSHDSYPIDFGIGKKVEGKE